VAVGGDVILGSQVISGPIFARCSPSIIISDLACEYRTFCSYGPFQKESNLVKDLLRDLSAKPFYSLLAFHDDRAVGHILFTSSRLRSAGKFGAVKKTNPLSLHGDTRSLLL